MANRVPEAKVRLPVGKDGLPQCFLVFPTILASASFHFLTQALSCLFSLILYKLLI